jgi:hypothetical protein
MVSINGSFVCIEFICQEIERGVTLKILLVLWNPILVVMVLGDSVTSLC